jgi:uncharacterized protein YcbX
MGGERVDALDVDSRGAAGDRAHALYDTFKGHPRRLTVRQVPRMLLWHASYGGGPVTLEDPPLPRLTAPDGAAWAWDDPGLPAALAADLERPVTLRRRTRLMQDLGDSVLVTVEATHRAVESELGPLDRLRWRTNLHVELDSPPFSEEGWEGAELVVGEARFSLLHACERCVIPTRDPRDAGRFPELLRWLARERGCLFGINARATGPGRIAEGDPVTIRYDATRRRPRPAQPAARPEPRTASSSRTGGRPLAR